ncbi:telomere length regulation protein-domain-containing protein [Phycomyces blakesleeanus]
MSSSFSLHTALEELDSLDTKAKQDSGSQFEIAVKCLEEPLKWLQSGIDQSSSLTFQQRLQLIQHPAWKRHLWVVCQTIIPHWAFALGPSSPHRNLLESTFVHLNDTTTNHTANLSQQQKQAQESCTMALTGLTILLECLVTEKDCSLGALEIYSQLIKNLVSPALLKLYIKSQTDTTDRSNGLTTANNSPKSTATKTTTTMMDSQFLCTLLCSIPARLGNAFGLQTIGKYGETNEWYLDKNYFVVLSRQLAYAAIETEEYDEKEEEGDSCVSKDTTNNYKNKLRKNKDKNKKSCIGFMAELLAKMLRQGYAETCIRTIYPIALAHLISAPWTKLWEDAERLSTSHGLSKATLFFVHETLMSQQTDKTQPIKGSVIKAVVVDLATIVFGPSPPISLPSLVDKTDTAKKQQQQQRQRQRRIIEFLKHVIFELCGVRWTDTDVLRLAIATAVVASGLDWDQDSKEWRLSEKTSTMTIELLTAVIEKWTDPVFIRHSSEKERHYITGALNILAGYLDKDSLAQVVSGTSLMSGITRWFGSADIGTAKLGVVVAESVSGRIDSKESRFACGVLDLQTDRNLFRLKDLIDTKDALQQETKCDEECLKDLFENDQDSNRELERELKEPEEETELDPDALFDPNESEVSEESDLEPYLMETESEEDNDDDDGDAHGPGGGNSSNGRKGVRVKAKSVRQPAYMLDLISYLEDHDDPVKLEIGLGAAKTIIRQKAGIGSEIGENCVQVASLLIRLPETYELTNFRQRQQDALVALVVAAPETVTSFIIDQIYNRNSSNGQKQLLLAVIALSVRELAGWTEDRVTDILDKAIDKKDPGSLSGTQLTRPTGTVRVFSHSTEIERKRKEATKANRLNGLAQPVFFTPLLLGWWEGAETRARWWIGHDKLLSERFIMTLNIILHSSTNTVDKRRIVTEYFEFCSSLRYTNCTRGMKRSMLLGIDTILNTSYRDQTELLVNQFTRELAGVQEWLQDIVEGVDEDEIKQLAIKLLGQIMQISMSA